jgi:AcrR family transcriptional regulator
MGVQSELHPYLGAAMPARLTRAERKQQTRAELLAAAQRVFLGRGFHGASLNEIAEEAGYTFGAVYSNFRNKDDLFLAVLDAEQQRRFPEIVDLMLDAPSLETGLRAFAREFAQYAQQHPNWTAVYVEFWTHASRQPELRRQVAQRHERLIDVATKLTEEFARRWEADFIIPAREVVRGTYALSRGIGLETLLDPQASPLAQFEDMFLAYALGAIRPRTGTAAPQQP